MQRSPDRIPSMDLRRIPYIPQVHIGGCYLRYYLLQKQILTNLPSQLHIDSDTCLKTRPPHHSFRPLLAHLHRSTMLNQVLTANQRAYTHYPLFPLRTMLLILGNPHSSCHNDRKTSTQMQNLVRAKNSATVSGLLQLWHACTAVTSLTLNVILSTK